MTIVKWTTRKGNEMEATVNNSWSVSITMDDEQFATGHPAESDKAKAIGAFAVIDGKVAVSEQIYNEMQKAMNSYGDSLEATRVLKAAAEAKYEILTEKEETKWVIRWNNANNEGGYGCTPERITIEQIEWAKEVLA